MAEVSFTGVSKVFAEDTVAVDDLTLTAADGEFLILVGPSGCGKTTALRLLAGLERPTQGEIRIAGEVVNDVQPRNRDIAMVFQNYALYPHMNVEKNLAFGLKQRRVPRDQIDERVGKVAGLLELEDLLKRKPGQLSGGQRQRVAMGRALVREPKAFLMDEPLSNLDAKLRLQMRAELKRLHVRLGITTIYVTHDQVEAMTLGDRIVVMSKGKVQQVGPPQEVYDHPANVFVAGFIGTPPMNLLRATASGGRITAGDFSFDRPGTPDGDLVIGLRPEHFDSSPEGGPKLDFEPEVIEPLGDEIIVHGSVAGRAPRVDTDYEIPEETGASRAVVIARFPPHSQILPGRKVELGIDIGKVHLFSAETGAAQT